MNLDEISQQIEELRSRVAALLQRTNSSSISEQEQVTAAFEQLQIALAELKGAEAEEQLQQQTERERLVVKIAQRIRQSLNLEEILALQL